MALLAKLWRWGMGGLFAIATVTFGVALVFTVVSTPWPHDPVLFLVSGFLLVLAVVSGKLGLSLAREVTRPGPLPAAARPEDQLAGELAARSMWYKTGSRREQEQLWEICGSGDLIRAEAVIQDALRHYPDDPLLRLQLAHVRFQTGQSALAERGYAGLLTEYDDLSPLARCTLMGTHLQSVIAQNDLARAEQLGMTHLRTSSGVAEKTHLLDGLATGFLSREPSAHLPQAEGWARQALALDPSALTLKGTLGSLLVEQGRFSEAEPYLRECYERSRALHDQGISAFYMANVEANKGNLAEARALARRATVLHHEPWLVQKANRKLTEWERALGES